MNDPKQVRDLHLRMVKMLLRLMRSNPRFSAFLTPTFCRQESFQLGLLMDSKDEEEKKEEELTPAEKLYNHYMQLEDEVLVKMGLRQAKVEERRKSSLGMDRRKSSTAQVMKGFLKP